MHMNKTELPYPSKKCCSLTFSWPETWWHSFQIPRPCWDVGGGLMGRCHYPRVDQGPGPQTHHAWPQCWGVEAASSSHLEGWKVDNEIWKYVNKYAWLLEASLTTPRFSVRIKVFKTLFWQSETPSSPYSKWFDWSLFTNCPCNRYQYFRRKTSVTFAHKKIIKFPLKLYTDTCRNKIKNEAGCLKCNVPSCHQIDITPHALSATHGINMSYSCYDFTPWFFQVYSMTVIWTMEIISLPCSLRKRKRQVRLSWDSFFVHGRQNPVSVGLSVVVVHHLHCQWVVLRSTDVRCWFWVRSGQVSVGERSCHSRQVEHGILYYISNGAS